MTIVRRILGRIDGHIMAPIPPGRLGAVRVLCGGFAMIYLFLRVKNLLGYAHFRPTQFQPVGLVAWLLDRPLPAWAVIAATLATTLLSVPFFLGWRFRIVGPLFAALFLWTLSYRHSWGMIFHTDNLLVFHVAILGLARSADAWSLDARRPASSPPVAGNGRYSWPLHAMAWVTVLAYVLAGLAKLQDGGLDWLQGNDLRNFIAADNARKILLGDIHSPLAAPLMHWTGFFKALAMLTLVVELGAPIALVHARLAAAWIVLAIGFHFGVLALMMIVFPYQMFGIAFACFLPVDRLFDRIARRIRRVENPASDPAESARPQ